MKAAVCRDFGQPLQVEDVELEHPRDGEVRITVKACGVCHSDLTYIDGSWGGDLPAVYGHEVDGVVDEVGDGVAELKPGQRVVASLIRACGRCQPCITGEPAICVATMRLDNEAPIRDGDGRPIVQGLRTAGWAESTLLHESQVVTIPDDIDPVAACLLGCAVITGVGAVVNTAGVMPGEGVVVIGAGGVGLNAVQGAAIAGAYPVIALDVNDRKLERASEFGATHVINAADETAERQLKKLTSGRLADAVLVTVGASEAVEQGLRMVRRGGRLVVVGMPGGSATSRLDATLFAYKGQRILGSKMGSSIPKVDVPRLISLYRRGLLKLDELVTGRYRLDQINEAVQALKRGDGIRNVIVFS
ncbi:MAG TPA: Zn-dependent alcohol dehydrogenase [Candidatus Dormibacteraeota bacterium]